MRRHLISLYPEAWRDRYGDEMRALLQDSPLTLRGTLDLLRGALLAHLRPLPGSAAAVRARTTVAQVLGCFIVFCAFGAGFAKTTENFDVAEHLHPLLGHAHAIILAAALGAGTALLLAAAPLALVALSRAQRTRDPRLLTLVAVLPAAGVLAAAAVGALALWSHAHPRTGAGSLLVLGLCAAALLVAGVACWAAPRAILRRIAVPRGAYAVALPALGLASLGMAAVTAATGVFLAGLVVDAPALGAMGNGPGQLIDVTTSIAIQFAAMLACTAGAAVSAARGLRSLPRLTAY